MRRRRESFPWVYVVAAFAGPAIILLAAWLAQKAGH